MVECSRHPASSRISTMFRDGRGRMLGSGNVTKLASAQHVVCDTHARRVGYFGSPMSPTSSTCNSTSGSRGLERFKKNILPRGSSSSRTPRVSLYERRFFVYRGVNVVLRKLLFAQDCVRRFQRVLVFSGKLVAKTFPANTLDSSGHQETSLLF